MPRVDQECTLSVHTHVREDQITLFGFTDNDQRRLFRMLISVSNVGPKIGSVVCPGWMKTNSEAQYLQGDVKRLSSVPGIGKRTAERIILELQDKMGPIRGLHQVTEPRLMICKVP